MIMKEWLGDEQPKLKTDFFWQAIAFTIGAGIVFAVCAFFAGCDRDIDGRTEAMRANDERLSIEYHNQEFKEREASANNCLKRGGIIVRSSWDGRIKDCR